MGNAPNVFIQNGLAPVAMIATKKENDFEKAEFSALSEFLIAAFLCFSDAVHGAKKTSKILQNAVDTVALSS